MASSRFTGLEDGMEQRFARRGTVISLAVAVGVLVAATALFIVLYGNKQADIRQVEERVGTTVSLVAEQNARLADTKSTVDKLDAERTRLTTLNAELRTCSDAAKASVVAAQKADKAAFDAAMDKIFTKCRR
jgi:flagellar basal body-associated protein FliL